MAFDHLSDKAWTRHSERSEESMRHEQAATLEKLSGTIHSEWSCLKTDSADAKSPAIETGRSDTSIPSKK